MVSVVIKNSYTVVPAEPTPNVPLPLNELDQRQSWTHTTTLYVYKPNRQADFEHTLRTSLSRALVPFYPLAGCLRWIGGGRLELHCNAMGAEFVVAESDSKMEHFGDFSPTPKFNDLLPAVDYSRPIEDLPILTVRITKFACGGLTIGMGMSHTAADGFSGLHFVSSWAKLARGENLPQNDAPFLDRSVLQREATQISRFNHVEYMPSPLLMGRSDYEEERAKESTVAMLKLTRAQADELKKMANVESQIDPPYSRFESITAHIWRCMCKARELCTAQPTVVLSFVCYRNRVKPPCPRRFFGNTVLPTITDACCAGELLSKPLGYAAEKLRRAIEKYTDEYILSALSFLKSQEDMKLVRNPPAFHIVGSKATFVGNPNLSVTSWITLPIEDADFGWGKPIYMGPGGMVSDGKCFIMPSCEQDGSLLLALRLQTQHMEVFKKFFYQDIDTII